MRILVTGFTPFGGETINPSWAAVSALPDMIGGAQIICCEIETAFESSCVAMAQAMEQYRPDAVLCVGQFGGSTCIRVERVAVNLRDAGIADNAGAQPKDEPVLVGAPEAHFATLPTRKIADGLKTAGIPAALSYSAGTFVCNNLLFFALHEAKKYTPVPRCGFLHVPYLPEQAANNANASSMSFETMVRALTRAIEIIAEDA